MAGNTIYQGMASYAAQNAQSAQKSERNERAGHAGQSSAGRYTETVKQAAVYERGQNGIPAESYNRSGQATTQTAVQSQAASSQRAQASSSLSYGKVVGQPKLSEEGQKYYNELKQKFGNLDFILVSKDMKGIAHSQASGYGNASKMVVLIDEDKIERMAKDEKYRSYYENVISQAQKNLPQLNSLMQRNPGIKKVGINVYDNGAGSFMAACAKGNQSALQKMSEKREAKKAEKKIAEKKAAKKQAEAKIEEKRARRRAEEKKAEQHDAGKEKRYDRYREESVFGEDDFDEYIENDDYEIIYADSMEELVSKLEEYTKQYGSDRGGFGGHYVDFQA